MGALANLCSNVRSYNHQAALVTGAVRTGLPDLPPAFHRRRESGRLQIPLVIAISSILWSSSCIRSIGGVAQSRGII